MKKNICGCVLLLLAMLFCSASVLAEEAEERRFEEFIVDLPKGWSGEERKNFLGKDSAGYMLVLGVLDESQEKFLAQASVYLLPNIKREMARDFAAKMAGAQGDASEIGAEGNFWVFTGEPRTQAVEGRATTMVAANPENLLIIIYQDPQKMGAAEVVKSLRGANKKTRKLLGR